jgi:hypothetical protein
MLVKWLASHPEHHSFEGPGYFMSIYLHVARSVGRAEQRTLSFAFVAYKHMDTYAVQTNMNVYM